MVGRLLSHRFAGIVTGAGFLLMSATFSWLSVQALAVAMFVGGICMFIWEEAKWPEDWTKAKRLLVLGIPGIAVAAAIFFGPLQAIRASVSNNESPGAAVTFTARQGGTIGNIDATGNTIIGPSTDNCMRVEANGGKIQTAHFSQNRCISVNTPEGRMLYARQMLILVLERRLAERNLSEYFGPVANLSQYEPKSKAFDQAFRKLSREVPGWHGIISETPSVQSLVKDLL